MYTYWQDDTKFLFYKNNYTLRIKRFGKKWEIVDEDMYKSKIFTLRYYHLKEDIEY